jgi:Rrf2 family nitric oxide-sensitive transcriptional repressor
MRLTAFTDYSLRVLIWLATEPGRRATIAQIAQAFEISVNHLVKVVHFLGKQGWIATTRGKGGGLALALPPESIGLGDVVRRTEGKAMVAECFGGDGSDCVIGCCCRLRGMLAEAVAAFEAVLDRYTLADIVANRHELARVLVVPAAREGRPA